METCGKCERNLDGVPVGTPCPDCASGRRDARAMAPTIAMTLGSPAPAVTLDIHNAVHAHTSDTVTLREVLTPLTFTAYINRPTPGDSDSLWVGGLTTQAGVTVSSDSDDVILGIAEAIAYELDD